MYVRTYYYRVGYSPAVLDDDFIVAKSFLCPGFSSTPEYQLILDADCSREQKKQMRELAEKQDLAYLQKTNDFSLLKWYHEQGIPQVIESQRKFHQSPV